MKRLSHISGSKIRIKKRIISLAIIGCFTGTMAISLVGCSDSATPSEQKTMADKASQFAEGTDNANSFQGNLENNNQDTQKSETTDNKDKSTDEKENKDAKENKEETQSKDTKSDNKSGTEKSTNNNSTSKNTHSNHNTTTQSNGSSSSSTTYSKPAPKQPKSTGSSSYVSQSSHSSSHKETSSEPKHNSSSYELDKAEANDLFDKINDFRRSNGYSSLHWSSSLASRAESSAKEDARKNIADHDWGAEACYVYGNASASRCFASFRSDNSHSKDLCLYNGGVGVSIVRHNNRTYCVVQYDRGPNTNNVDKIQAIEI